MAHYKFHNDCQSSVLTYEQVKRLDIVMDQTVPIHGRGNYPTLCVKLKELIRLVKYKLQKEHSIDIRDIRLNGGAANYVLAPENSHYNDLDLIFGTDLSDESRFDVIRDVVLDCLMEFYPRVEEEEPSSTTTTLIETPSTKVKKLQEDDDGKTNLNDDNDLKLKKNISQMIKSTISDSNVLSNNIQANGKPSERDEKCPFNYASDERNKSCCCCCCCCCSSSNNNKAIKNVVINSCPKMRMEGSDETTSCGVREKVGICRDSGGLQAQYGATNRNLPRYQQAYQMPLSHCAVKEAYVHKMVKVNDDDRWSLISLGVQQSEANCTSSSQANQQFAVTLACDNNGCNRSSNQQQVGEKSNMQPANAQQQQQHQQYHSTHMKQHQQQKQAQFPNSIELKFVDRMRRKFEFSVDSFQIILDSLIQFYDYAPQSTITSQIKLANSHPSSTMINITRPIMSNNNNTKRRCKGCCKLEDCCLTSRASIMHEGSNDYEQSNDSKQQQQQQHHQQRDSILDDTVQDHYHYQLPIEHADSPSVASSSGCSSSSSVVSSSSLSCDEDQEDLYGDTDGPTSSSASTSSLLSSTTSSVLFSELNSCDAPEQPHRRSPPTKQQQQQRNDDQQTKRPSKRSQKINQSNKDDQTTMTGTTSNKLRFPVSQVSLAKESTPSKCVNLVTECVDCSNQHQNNLVDDDDDQNVYELETNNRTSCAVISENFYPTVIGRSEYGNFKEALYHLERKLIATRSPEEIRGGGLLKYCNLLVKNYKPTNVYQIRTLERYMCSRFFIDFSDLNQQQAKLESYLANHFSDDPILKFDYLTILHNVVQRSTVCLMNHELRLTLNMIRDLAYKLNEQQQQQQHHHHHHHQQQQHQHQHQHQQKQNQQSMQSQNGHQLASQPSHQQVQQQYYQQKPFMLQSGIYKVKLVNYTLAKPIKP